jgi:hypothetical protein
MPRQRRRARISTYSSVLQRRSSLRSPSPQSRTADSSGSADITPGQVLDTVGSLARGLGRHPFIGVLFPSAGSTNTATGTAIVEIVTGIIVAGTVIVATGADDSGPLSLRKSRLQTRHLHICTIT